MKRPSKNSKSTIGVNVTVVTDVVVTLLAVRSLDFQQIYPICVEEAFFGNDPCGACRPEVTPTVVRMETRRGIAAVRSRSVIFLFVVVLYPSEITLRIVIGCVRTVGTVRHGTRKLVVRRVEHIRFAGIHIIEAGTVVFVADHRRDAVQPERLRVVQQLLIVHRVAAGMFLAHDTVRAGITAVIRVGHTRHTRFVHIDTVGRRELEVFQEGDFSKRRTVYRVAFAPVRIQDGIRQGV